MVRLSHIALLSGMLSLSAPAAEILLVAQDGRNIAITHEDSRKWNVDETACVMRSGKQISCGKITKVSHKGAIVELDHAPEDLMVGETVQPRSNLRSPAAQITTERVYGGESYLFDISGGLALNYNFFYPLLHVQIALSPNVALGIEPIFYKAASATTALSGLGGYATLNIYSQNYFRGFWVQLAGGMLQLNAETTDATLTIPTDTAKTMIGMVTLGWRGYWDLGLNVGIGLGAQYIAQPEFQVLQVDQHTPIQPIMVMDVGFNF